MYNFSIVNNNNIIVPVFLYFKVYCIYSRSGIGLKSLKIRIIVIIREKVDPVIQTHGVSKCVVNISV